MQVLSRKSLPLGGFAGLTEHRLVTDRRVFGSRKAPNTFDGIGNFVYLADAQFNPHGETHMHPHKEIDVISIMMSGQVSHEGSLEHGQSLKAGEVQVQRAGGEGFSHNEKNPDSSKNRMLQLWVLPEVAGQPAGYNHYPLPDKGVTRIYGGKAAGGKGHGGKSGEGKEQGQKQTFASKTTIDVVRLASGESINFKEEILAYVSNGTADFSDENNNFNAEDGDLIRSYKTEILATSDVEIVVIGQAS